MRSILVASGLAAVLVGAPAFAADLPTRKEAPPMPAPVLFTWTGCYVGLHVGGDFGHVSAGDPINDGTDTSGMIGGGQVGCNYQTQNFVIGAEGELWASGLRGSVTSIAPAGVAPLMGTARAKSEVAGDVALRGGFAMDRTLFYGKLGVALANYDFNADAVGFGVSADENYTGLLLGLGLEYAVDMHWSLKAEYDYIYYPDKTVNFAGGGFTQPVSIRPTENLIKVGANYRF